MIRLNKWLQEKQTEQFRFAGISVRFMNSPVLGDNLKNASEITNLISRVKFEGEKSIANILSKLWADPSSTKHRDSDCSVKIFLRKEQRDQNITCGSLHFITEHAAMFYGGIQISKVTERSRGRAFSVLAEKLGEGGHCSDLVQGTHLWAADSKPNASYLSPSRLPEIIF